MANQAFPSVNAQECSWADIVVSFNVPDGANVDLVDLESVKYSRKVEVGESRGTSSGRVMKRTAGSETVEASATMTRSGAAVLMEALEVAAMSAGFVRGNEVIISGVSFDVLIQHTPVGDSRIYTTKLVGCRFLSDSLDHKQGNEADMVEIDLSPIKIATKSATGQWIVLR